MKRIADCLTMIEKDIHLIQILVSDLLVEMDFQDIKQLREKSFGIHANKDKQAKG
jgi:hypothetical protein